MQLSLKFVITMWAGNLYLSQRHIAGTEGRGHICHTVSLPSIPVTSFEHTMFRTHLELPVLQHGWWLARCSSQELHGIGKWSLRVYWQYSLVI